MPTLSQCQILNSLVERKVVLDECPIDEDDYKDVVQAENTRHISVVGHRASTPQPTYNGIIHMDNNRPVSVGGKARNSEGDHEMTPFQRQRMQMIANTAWRPKSLWTIEVSKLKPSSMLNNRGNANMYPQEYTTEEAARARAVTNIWNRRASVYERQNSNGNVFPPVEDASRSAFYPWRRMASQKQLLIKPVLETISPDYPSERTRNLSRSNSNPPELNRNLSRTNSNPPVIVGLQSVSPGKASERNQNEVDVVTRENTSSTRPTVQFTEPEKEADVAEEDQHNEVEEEPSPIVTRKEKLFMKCPQDVKDKLYLLGWRKPEKKRKKIKKKAEETTKNARLTYMTMPKLDLMKDPMLRKLAKKSKNVIVQANPPQMKPRAVCFDIIGAHLTHVVVWKSFQRDILSEYEEVKVESIQFVPRSIFVPRHKNADPVENRWVIMLENEWHRSRVTGMDIHFAEFTAPLKRYDDVVNLEYRQYTRMTEMMKMIKRKH